MKKKGLFLTAIGVAALGQCPAIASETITYKYDPLGRLTQASSAGTINNGIQSNYCFDPADNRRRINVSGVGTSPNASKCTNAANGSDFNADGRDDILWRNDSGALTDWLANPNGSFTSNDANAYSSVPTSWKVAGTGDFNGDGHDDILWRNDSGLMSEWLGTASGGFTDNGGTVNNVVAAAWHVQGIGDFNGDGRSDILWRNDSGQLSEWLGTANGGFTDNGGTVNNVVAAAWHVQGIGDFNGDGRSDILWRNDSGQVSDWLGQSDGSFIGNDTNALTSFSTSWKIAGVGDFNGDGRSDILWRNVSTNGVINWLGTANGGFTDNSTNSSYTVGWDWTVVGTGDYNGDGMADLLWRSSTGTLSDWLGTGTGAFTNNDANASTSVSLDWKVQGGPVAP
jgi:hypothetical protein